MICWTYFGHYDDEKISLMDREYATQCNSHMARIATWNPEPANGEPNIVRKSPDEVRDARDEWLTAKVNRNYQRILNNLNVYVVAEKYNLPVLKNVVRAKFFSIFSSKWTVAQTCLLFDECDALPPPENEIFEMAVRHVLRYSQEIDFRAKLWEYRTDMLKLIVFDMLMVLMRQQGEEFAARLRGLVRILAAKDYDLWVSRSRVFVV